MRDSRKPDQSAGQDYNDDSGAALAGEDTRRGIGRRWVVATIGLGILSPLTIEGQDLIDGPDTKSGSDAILRREREARMTLAGSFPYPLVEVSVDDALATWERMRSGAGTPVVLGDLEEVGKLTEYMSLEWDGMGPPEAILEKASAFRFPDDLRARQRAETAAAMKTLSEDAQAREFVQSLSEMGAVFDAGPEIGIWPDVPSANPGLWFPETYDLSNGEVVVRKPERVMIATFPTDDWTEVFAYARFGGWNACPWPHEHIAAFRHWTARYRLELVGMSHDTLQLRAGQRPETREEALALAREQFDYCPDIGEGSLSEMAASLMASDWWFFWWD